jgi:hypothetical protein
MIMPGHIRWSEFWHIRQPYIYQPIQAGLCEIAVESVRLHWYIRPLYIYLCIQAECYHILLVDASTHCTQICTFRPFVQNKIDWAVLAACYILLSCLACSLTLKMEVICSSKMSVDYHQTTQCCVSKDFNSS